MIWVIGFFIWGLVVSVIATVGKSDHPVYNWFCFVWTMVVPCTAILYLMGRAAGWIR